LTSLALAILDFQATATGNPARTGGSPPLSPQQSLAAIKLADNLEVELVAAEPLVSSPVAIAFGPDGRLWVCEMYDYPAGIDGKYTPGGRIKVLEDTRGNGKYDKATVFLDKIPLVRSMEPIKTEPGRMPVFRQTGLPFPTGVTVWRKGVLVCAAPDIFYAEPGNGRGNKQPEVQVLYTGFGKDNYQARINSLSYGLDGWLYGSCGLYGGPISCFAIRPNPPLPAGEKSWAWKTVKLGNRDFRIKPDLGYLEAATGRTQQGRVRDDWGNWFGCDNMTLCVHYPLHDHYLRRNPHFAPPPPGVVLIDDTEPNRLHPIRKDLQLFKLSGPPGVTTAACGIGVYRDNLLGKQYTGNLFTCEPVNLLVHRRVLTPKGSTFSGKRSDQEQRSEFLASTDNWFRPVQAVTGPDGCLYIVDMYRFVIEHPRWIPKEDLAKLDVRAGSTMGRIYRIKPKGKAPRLVLRLDKLDTRGLVAALESPNGCQRDLAHMMLLWRGDRSAAKLLEDMVIEGKRAEGRLHALCLLDGLGLLKGGSLIVQSALQDEHPGVRRHAVRLTEGRYRQVDNLMESMADDPDPQVRLQVALSMGHWPEPEQTGPLLAKLAVDKKADAYLRAAVLSSLTRENVGVVLRSVLNHKNPPPALVRQVVGIATGLGRTNALPGILWGLNALEGERYSSSLLTATAGFLEALERRGEPLDKAVDERATMHIHAMMRGARAIAVDSKADPDERLAAVDLLGRLPKYLADDAKTLAKLLMPASSPGLQSAAVAALGRIADPQVPGLLTAAWRSSSPGVQSQIADVLFSRDAWLRQFLESIDKKSIPPGQVGAAHRQRLLQHKDKEIRALGASLFRGGTSPDRQKVLKAYRDVPSLVGRAKKGQAIFVKSCAACHRLGEVGHAVGPDLATVRNRTSEFLLIALLDPNREVDPRYIEYVAVTKAGRTLTGILAGETAASITLRGQAGREETLLRSDLEELVSSNRSMMPEGLEKELSPQDLADLFAFLRAGARTPK
jgi:putative membrane-bound dehydrogenase-like protein